MNEFVWRENASDSIAIHCVLVREKEKVGAEGVSHFLRSMSLDRERDGYDIDSDMSKSEWRLGMVMDGAEVSEYWIVSMT